MAGTVYIQTAANLFCGDHDPTKSKHLTLDEMRLPSLEANYGEHTPGGALVGVEFELGIKKLEAGFKLKGFDPDLMVQFGLGSRLRKVFTSYGVIVDKRTGRSIESKAIIEARLGKVTPDAFRRGDLAGYDYGMNEIMNYQLYFDGKEMIYWDFFSNAWRVDGVDQNRDENQILRVTGAA
jgi:P2 family phage contractile tail tube protein